MAKLYRVELTPEVYSIIEAEAYLSGKSLKSIASEIISEHCSEKAKEIALMKDQTQKKTEESNDQMIVEAEDQDYITIEKLPLTNADLEYIKTQWLAGLRSREIGEGMTPKRNANTIQTAVESMKDNGEIPRDKYDSFAKEWCEENKKIKEEFSKTSESDEDVTMRVMNLDRESI